jgi:uncharacterized MAPEG superfamily protein
VILGLVQLIVGCQFICGQYGYRWSASNREEQKPPLRGIASRVDQATTNFLETFPFFAVLVLVAHFVNRHGVLTIWGLNLYFWGRVGYVLARCNWVRACALHGFLEYGAHWDGVTSHRALDLT